MKKLSHPEKPAAVVTPATRADDEGGAATWDKEVVGRKILSGRSAAARTRVIHCTTILALSYCQARESSAKKEDPTR